MKNKSEFVVQFLPVSVDYNPQKVIDDAIDIIIAKFLEKNKIIDIKVDD